MINSKTELREYLEADHKALFIDHSKPNIFDDIWKYEILLRKTEYYKNCRKDILGRLIYSALRILFHKRSVRLGYSIPLNTCGAGLSLAHYGDVTINQHSHLGRNCRIYNGVVIGSKGHGGGTPQIGDNVFIGAGAKVLGDIVIANNTKIAANAVVLHSVDKEGCTLIGIPATIITPQEPKNN